ncbi:MAG: thiamine-phosphate kinase [Candidatus Hydrogenedentales bacterium]|jgi:thiamine-monophosphate kinase
MSTVRDIGEFGLIDRIARFLPTSPSVILGVGDDCAVLRFCERMMLVSCDLFVENVHFRQDYAQPEQIGWKAAASSMSDIAAMGGQPMFVLVALGCSPDMPAQHVQLLYRGMSSAVSRFGAAIVGGDTSMSPEALVLDVTVIGQGIGNRCLTRRGARAGDALAVTGPLGLAAAGLHSLQHGHPAPALQAAHLSPRPRIPEGQWLCSQPFAHAMIDISDGLAQDAKHIADASKIGVSIDSAKLPVHAELQAYCEQHGLDPLRFILAGGDDYELAAAVDGEHAAKAVGAFGNEFRTGLSVVGEFTTEWTGVRVDGQPLDETGYSHFSSGPSS